MYFTHQVASVVLQKRQPLTPPSEVLMKIDWPMTEYLYKPCSAVHQKHQSQVLQLPWWHRFPSLSHNVLMKGPSFHFFILEVPWGLPRTLGLPWGLQRLPIESYTRINLHSLHTIIFIHITCQKFLFSDRVSTKAIWHYILGARW